MTNVHKRSSMLQWTPDRLNLSVNESGKKLDCGRTFNVFMNGCSNKHGNLFKLICYTTYNININSYINTAIVQRVPTLRRSSLDT